MHYLGQGLTRNYLRQCNFWSNRVKCMNFSSIMQLQVSQMIMH